MPSTGGQRVHPYVPDEAIDSPNDEPTLMRLRNQILSIAALAAVAATAWYGRDHLTGGAPSTGDRPGGPPAVLVEVGEARRGDVSVRFDVVGSAHANEAVTITSKVTGIVSRVVFAEGDRVKAGDPLVELDSREIQAELEGARAERDNAKRLFDRAVQLYESRSIARARVDDLQGDLTAAEARVRAAEARILDFTIRAPFAGRLGLRRLSVGALVSPGSEITTLDDTSRIKVDFRVPELALAHLSARQSVVARSAVYPDRAFEGRIATVDTRVDPVSRSIQVRTVFENPDDALRPGMFLTAELLATVRRDSVLVPEQAIVVSGDTQYVFVVSDGQTGRRDITTGEHVGGEIEVLTGLAGGEQVVVGGVQKVREGTRVTTKPATGARPGGGVS